MHAEREMQRVAGFGGFFFRARDPERLARWYSDHLGIAPAPTDTGELPWMAEGGPVVFAPFAADSDYFAADHGFMLNFRVRDLDAFIAQLRAAGVEVGNAMAMDGVGRFARLHDPEGNPIELWQPEGV